MTRIRWYGPTLVLLVTVLLVLVAGPGVARRIAHAAYAERVQLVREDLAKNPSLAELSDAFRKVAQVVEPSVVHISVAQRGDARPQMRGQIPDELWERFFGPGARPPQQQEEPDGRFDKYDPVQPYGVGSGWIYDENGHVITNNHVVRKPDGQLADEITVRFHDGSERKATVVGADARTDVAVLKVEGGSLHPATIAPANSVEQGDIVFAFGSPFGERFSFSMSQGIVSGKGRQVGIIGRGGYENFIQTDAAINPGNSGGPLTNIYGQVIGMNTAIATRTGAFSGVGFAIPTDMLTAVADQLIDTGKVRRGYLGIYIEDLSPKMARTFNFDGKGVLVTSPIPGGPATKAGLQAGDIITQLNGRGVDSADALRNTVAAMAPGSDIDVTYFRDGKLVETKITIGELPDQVASAGAPGIDTPKAKASRELLEKLGLTQLQTIGEQEAQQLNLPAGTSGVLVMNVRGNSVADSQRLGRGSVITAVMGVNVATVEDLVAQLEKHDLKQGVRVSVLERGPDREWLPRFALLELSGGE